MSVENSAYSGQETNKIKATLYTVEKPINLGDTYKADITNNHPECARPTLQYITTNKQLITLPTHYPVAEHSEVW